MADAKVARLPSARVAVGASADAFESAWLWL